MTKKVDDLIHEILKTKIDLEMEDKKPRVILLGEECFELINGEFLESIQELPWGDTLSYELEKQREVNRNIFLAEGSLFGLWVIRINTIEGFKVF